MADFRHLPTRCKFIALMPQWDFLNFLAEQGRRYPAFHLLMQTEATDLIERGRPRRRPAREDAGRRPRDPRRSRDRLRRPPFDRARARGPRGRGPRRADRRAVVPAVAASTATPTKPAATSRPARCWSCSTAATTGSAPTSSRRAASKRCSARACRRSASASRRCRRSCATASDELKSLDDIKLLTVAIDRLRHWHRPGLLCIGDAAHAMSPVGGVGVNLAVQDAVAAANILAEPLRAGTLTTSISPQCRRGAHSRRRSSSACR